MEMNMQNPPQSPMEPEKPVTYPARSRELVFAALTILSAMFLCNSFFYGGFRLGFAIGLILCVLCGSGYLTACGRRHGFYSGFLLVMSIIIAAGFGRSGDGFVKAVMIGFLFISINLCLTLQAGKQRRNPGAFSTLGDAFYTAIIHSFRLDRSFRGLKEAFRKSGTTVKKGSAIITGLLIAVPLLVIMVFLLMRADAAFEGLMDLLPEIRLGEIFLTLFFGGILAFLQYTKGAALCYAPCEHPAAPTRKGINALTIHTILIAVCAVYLVYLFSQLAYFAGGFAGILPEGYTTAEYARRGFFEMAWLCAINLTVITLSVALVEKKQGTPLLTKLLCLFISLITVFFVITASGKMFLYIETYGLTRLRVLTQVIMLWLCITTILVALWLFLPKIPYMKGILAAAMILGALVFWLDVDTVVARYNVNAYLSGTMENIDVSHLRTLGETAAPYIGALAKEAPDPEVREMAADILENWYHNGWYVDVVDDFRGWTYAEHAAKDFLPEKPA